ncbi:hypothetical protein VNO77_26883 [Canavalia gladiata]|uniref:non-specific serine/threonine protein kinase n=1 Tax=Canavalia gladiata TaxID=3824 RepID=A0AAN9KUU1_CANGL
MKLLKMFIFSNFLFLSLVFCFTSLTCGVTTLSQDEVEALKDIAKTLGKNNWDFNIDPCSQKPPWVTPNARKGEENSVTCDCTVGNDNFCHVVSIILKQQNLQGKLPPELVRLPYLQEITLPRNYLDGTIPKEWGFLKLVNISIYANRVSGPIPKELGNITTLKKLDLVFNQLSGDLSHLGNLPNIEILHLTSNNFTGELPETFSRFTTLKELRLGDNKFSGKIPNFIQRWTNLTQLVIEGSGLSGPIPSGISFLQNLKELIITDLNGPDSTFPRLDNMTALTTLILRSCNINDTIPPNLAKLTRLKLLDLSYNKLSGHIPTNFEVLKGYIYLTKNFFTGPVPRWIKNAKIDLSYNNLSDENPEAAKCQEGDMNLFASFQRNNSGPISCVRNSGCIQDVTSLYINCGGDSVTTGDKTYEGDAKNTEPTKFVEGGNNWGFSNTGYFLDNDTAAGFPPYITENKTRLYMDDIELYKNARISPISLTYYGFCLKNGKYTVKLHFAEIMFTDDKTFSSLGRRVFDVYIQEKLVMKDFNIANEAQGVGKKIIKQFPAYVSSNDLEIRFYWDGKGTTNLPYKSVHGPLISAIFVDKESTSSIPRGVVVAIVVAAIMIIILSIVGILWWRGCLGKKALLAKGELKDLSLQTSLFTLHQIKAATNNFDISNKIGEGGFGPVYKGIMSNGMIIAVKQLSSKSKQGNREFLNEIGMISALQHPNLVKLYGCCVEGDQLLLVYEYMENNSLAYALFGPEEFRIKLDWPTRYKICVGIARGLSFLHEESRLKIVHRDIKATNVLLDKDLNPKISDFGLAKLDEEDNTHISTRIAGTYGYMAPEYAMHGYLTDKADVYSFGIVALEIVSGKSNTIQRAKDQPFFLLNWAHLLKEKGNLMELVDQKLNLEFNEEEVMMMINVALLCTNVVSTQRPTMSSVISMLEGKLIVPEFDLEPNKVKDHWKKLEAMEQYYSQVRKNNISMTQSTNFLESWTPSSSSTSDLYPINTDSSNWEKRN